MADVAATDERRHRRGPEPEWAESWYFDFSAHDGSTAGYVRLTLYPNMGVAWYWAALVGDGRRLVMVNDHDLELPRGRDLEVRGQGIWSMVTCETPLDHWSVGLEAFAVALDDPTEAFRGERGDRIGLGFDLEWEATAPASVHEDSGGYRQSCRVSGEILVGDERLDLDAAGDRNHRWGVEDWWDQSAPDAVRRAVGDPAGIRARSPLLLVAPDGRSARLMRALVAESSLDGTGDYRWRQWLVDDVV